jgi:DNA-directed RNA polymerase subunit RPC12/RpoP
MRRVHRRTMWERINYMAVYKCRDCHAEAPVQRRFRYHLGMDCRCPKCGTERLSKLRERDPVDPMWDGFLNLMERLAGGKLYHCRYCRVQFYDRRQIRPIESGGTESTESQAVMTPQNTANSGA